LHQQRKFICLLQPSLLHLLLTVPGPWVSPAVVVPAPGRGWCWQASQGLWSSEPGPVKGGDWWWSLGAPSWEGCYASRNVLSRSS